MADVVYELMAKIGLDDKEFNNGLKGAGNTLKSWGSTAGKVALTGAKVIGAGIAAGATAVAALTKSAVESYAEYEQLVGGVETLFGAGGLSLEEYAQSVGKSVDEVKGEYDSLMSAQETVMKNAGEAYKTAGLSANEYMETVTSFSASLIQSLGGDTEKAAQYADMAIVDMSDNANKMGTSMESIQNAYQGFAKQNYTMLDNLKLGYGGTKSEMERLVEDAEKLNTSFKAQRDENGNLTLSYADVVDAIHIVQENMGIAGTTAKEAATTISGSVGSMKAAWKNLVTGLADGNADIEQLIDDLLVTIIGENGEGGVINNIMPAVERALNGIVTLITTIVPKITPIITDLISQNLPMLVEAGMQLLVALISGIIQGLPQLIATLPQIFDTIKTVFMENWPALKEAGSQLLQMIGEGIISVLGHLDEKLAEVGLSISNKLDETWQKVKHGAVNVWDNIKTAVAEKVESVKNSIVEKFENIREKIADIIDRIKGIFHFEWEFPKPKLPHFSINWRDLGIISIPDISIEWYKKAYNNPYMFTKPTVMGFGDGNGGEIVYGHNSLLNDIKQAVKDVGSNQPILITVQSVLDGKVIGETAYKYQRNLARAVG